MTARWMRFISAFAKAKRQMAARFLTLNKGGQHYLTANIYRRARHYNRHS